MRIGSFTTNLTILLCNFLFLNSGNANEKIIDAHFHFISSKNRNVLNEVFKEGAVGAKEAVKLMDGAGIEKAVALSAAYFFSDEKRGREENNFVASEVNSEPNRLIGFCSVRVGADWALRELNRCKKSLGLSGLKLHLSTNQISLLESKNRTIISEIFAKATQLNLPVLIDIAKWDPNEFVQLVNLMLGEKKGRFIIAHALAAWYRNLTYLLMIYQENPSLPRNIFVDLSGTAVFYAGSPEADSLVWYLRKLGISQVFFGSDYPAFSPKQSVNALNRLPFTTEELIQIKAENFIRIWYSSSERKTEIANKK